MYAILSGELFGILAPKTTLFLYFLLFKSSPSPPTQLEVDI